MPVACLDPDLCSSLDQTQPDTAVGMLVATKCCRQMPDEEYVSERVGEWVGKWS